MNLFVQSGENLHLVLTHYDKSNKETKWHYKELSPKRYENTNNGLTEFVQAFASIQVVTGLPVIQGDRIKLEDGIFYVVANIQKDKVDNLEQHKAQFLKIDEYQVLNLQVAK